MPGSTSLTAHIKEEGTMDTKTERKGALIGTYDSHVKAEEVVRALERAGFDMKKLSIIGKGYHTEEHPVGFYTTGDRMKSWGGIGAFWGGLWGLLFGAAFFWIPGIGPIAVAGPFVQMLVGAVEGATVVGGLSAVGAALASLGLSKTRIVKYETLLRSDKYLLIAHGTPEEVRVARDIMEQSQVTETEVVAA
jgi:hypothetical protein